MKNSNIILYILALFSVFLSIFFALQPDSIPSLLFSALFRDDYAEMQPYLRLDQFLSKNAPEGNLLLRLAEADMEDEGPNPQVLAFYYSRSVYRLYPRKVFVGDPRDESGDILKAMKVRAQLERAVLDQYGIKTIITLRRNAKGGFDPKVTSVH